MNIFVVIPLWASFLFDLNYIRGSRNAKKYIKIIWVVRKIDSFWSVFLILSYIFFWQHSSTSSYICYSSQNIVATSICLWVNSFSHFPLCVLRCYLTLQLKFICNLMIKKSLVENTYILSVLEKIWLLKTWLENDTSEKCWKQFQKLSRKEQ